MIVKRALEPWPLPPLGPRQQTERAEQAAWLSVWPAPRVVRQGANGLGSNPKPHQTSFIKYININHSKPIHTM